MIVRTPKLLSLIIALPMLLLLGGASNSANRLELQPATPQSQPFLDLEIEDSTQTVPMELLLPDIFYDRTRCQLYGKC
ncbi:MAG: hypothetical protein AAFO04_25985 [Cyanobacteria bacterium J06592_8]